MVEICPPSQCTGCFACENTCPKQCISMHPDSLGALHPVIDNDICINCNICRKVCPNNAQLIFDAPRACYAAARIDQDARALSASGGIGALFAEYMISKKGIVAGTAYDKNMLPVTKLADTLNGIEVFKGSKYVQSIVGKSFSEIKDFLDHGNEVLYISTPCQISGLKSFLRKQYPNLITVDLICHGVCPASYFKEEIKHICSQHKIPQITNVAFRGNGKKYKYNLNFFFTIFNEDRVVFNRPAMQEFYFYGFLKGITLRQNCYSCQYARPERIADLTIGDFIGLGKETPYKGNSNNVSIITINTDKGNNFLKKIVEYAGDELELIERDYSEAIKYGPSLRGPFPRHTLTSKFQSLYPQYGFTRSIRKTLFRHIIINRILYWPKRLFIAAPRKIIRIMCNSRK